MTETTKGMNGRAAGAVRRHRPDAPGRVAELEAEVEALRRALARAGLDAGRAAGRHGGALAGERAGRAADAAGARSAAAAAEARHGRAMAAGRADLAASEEANGALRRANAELAASRAALREREERLRLILASATDYAIITADTDRRVTAWNAGAQHLLGWSEDEIVGRSADAIFTPEDREAGAPEREAEGALRDGRAVNERWHLRKDGTRFWGSGLAMPLRDPEADPAAPPIGVLKVMRDETGRKRAEERQAALLELGDRLRDLRDAAEIARTAAEVIGRTLGGTRAGCGIVDTARGVLRIERDWTDGRASSIAGELRIADFWADLAAEHRPGGVVAVEDAGRDPRTADRAAAYAAAGLRAFLDVPLVEAGRVAAILFVHDAAPRAWTAGEIAFVRGVADRAWAAVERARAEQHRTLLVNEMNHRAKNALAVVQAMLRLTKATDVPAFVRGVEGRVAALARAHTLLADRQWAGSSLHDLVRGELAPFMAGRATLDGPAVTLPAVAAQPVAMAVHELATNAAKHGALSAEAGTVAVVWRVEGRDLRIRWAESGGPPVAGPPKRRGFGTRLLETTIRQQLRGSVEKTWAESGLLCDVVIPLA